MTVAIILAVLGLAELAGLLAAAALCGAASRRPKYGPPITPPKPRRRSTDRDA